MGSRRHEFLFYAKLFGSFFRIVNEQLVAQAEFFLTLGRSLMNVCGARMILSYMCKDKI